MKTDQGGREFSDNEKVGSINCILNIDRKDFWHIYGSRDKITI